MKLKSEGYTPISSGHIAGAKYDPLARDMTVKFQNGYVYRVHGVTPHDYQQFMAAPSQGEHWHQVIKNNFGIERVK